MGTSCCIEDLLPILYLKFPKCSCMWYLLFAHVRESVNKTCPITKSIKLVINSFNERKKKTMHTCRLQGGYGQYCWSMMMGFCTLFMKMFWKIKPETERAVEEAIVLILNPFVVSLKVQLLTFNPTTSFSSLYLPKLPTLIPWPGPQNTSETLVSEVPESMAMQSSPVPIAVLEMLILFELPILIPSVLGCLLGLLFSLCWNASCHIQRWRYVHFCYSMMLYDLFLHSSQTQI